MPLKGGGIKWGHESKELISFSERRFEVCLAERRGNMMVMNDVLRASFVLAGYWQHGQVDRSLLTPEGAKCHERLSSGMLLCELAAAVDYAASGASGWLTKMSQHA